MAPPLFEKHNKHWITSFNKEQHNNILTGRCYFVMHIAKHLRQMLLKLRYHGTPCKGIVRDVTVARQD